ncbi:MAG: glycoside hydrolase family 3 C-terminal domain-containing protein [Rikenellaceae bacterium]|nr:glycoside hydrolase family 3 C-terminal domain-containing protein [Rikenellaceae bacterium]
MKNHGKIACWAVVLMAIAVSCREKPEEFFRTVENGDGPTLGYSPVSGVAIIERDGYCFKDLDRNGELDPYEDWRLDARERAADLASRLSIEQIAGLMLCSPYQLIPDTQGHYNEKPYQESGTHSWEVSDRQKSYIQEKHIRHLLIKGVPSVGEAALWNNRLQSFAEAAPYGIPVTCAANPYHSDMPFLQDFPQELALAATFDPRFAGRAGKEISDIYRAMGIFTVFSPSADLGTDPRWKGIIRTFGESPQLSAEMAKAYIEGLQSDKSADPGGGNFAVNSFVGHWPGAGTGEGGRDAAYAFGKFGVYPGDNFQMHLLPFAGVLGPDSTAGGSSAAAGIIPSYAIQYAQSPDSTDTGSAYSQYMINGLLRGEYGFDGVVCTMWGVTHPEGVTLDIYAGKPWGAEQLTPAERHYRLIMAGVDQFAGNDDLGPLLEAYRMGVELHGDSVMRERFDQSAVRILKNMFRVGLFENPYTDPYADTEMIEDGLADFRHQTALRSMVLLKNRENVLPVTEREKVYIPKSYYPSRKGWGGRGGTQEHWDYPVDPDLVDLYFEFTEEAEGADFAVVFIDSPGSGDKLSGYDINDRTAGGNGYVPISLQYRPYTADSARMHSIAAGDPVIDSIITDRSYWEKTVSTSNEKELEIVIDTKWKMQGKPVVVVVNLTRPMVFGELEPKADAIIARLGTSPQAVFEIISGRSEPSGLLPVQMPRDMITVELQQEDVPFDMECYTDSQGNIYDFAFGLDWKGAIRDSRTERYARTIPQLD